MRATGTTDYDYNQTTVLDIGNGYNNSGYEITGYVRLPYLQGSGKIHQ